MWRKWSKFFFKRADHQTEATGSAGLAADGFPIPSGGASWKRRGSDRWPKRIYVLFFCAWNQANIEPSNCWRISFTSSKGGQRGERYSIGSKPKNSSKSKSSFKPNPFWNRIFLATRQSSRRTRSFRREDRDPRGLIPPRSFKMAMASLVPHCSALIRRAIGLA
jgi:hypothetical protein